LEKSIIIKHGKNIPYSEPWNPQEEKPLVGDVDEGGGVYASFMRGKKEKETGSRKWLGVAYRKR